MWKKNAASSTSLPRVLRHASRLLLQTCLQAFALTIGELHSHVILWLRLFADARS